MLASQHPWVELYEAVLSYDGSDAYSDLLEPWPARNPDECRWLADFDRRVVGQPGEATYDDLCRLYAASRLASVLLLRFQSGRADGSDYLGPPIDTDGYQLFHESLGFYVPTVPRFHPFFHEIERVHQTEPADTPIDVVEQVWPPLMLGGMMFSRAGCVVSGGAEHVVKDIAERSKLYWSVWRKYRPCADESHGWGSNSQWRTRFRRDHQRPDGFCYNVDGNESLNAMTEDVDGLPVGTMIELVRNRGLVRTAVEDGDLYPYRYSYTETG